MRRSSPALDLLTATASVGRAWLNGESAYALRIAPERRADAGGFAVVILVSSLVAIIRLKLMPAKADN